MAGWTAALVTPGARPVALWCKAVPAAECSGAPTTVSAKGPPAGLLSTEVIPRLGPHSWASWTPGLSQASWTEKPYPWPKVGEPAACL